MPKEITFIITESIEGGFEAKAALFSIFTQGETLPDLRLNIKDAVACHFDENEAPQFIHLHIVKDELMAV